MQVSELSGVEPNPRIQTVRRGVETCKSEGIDMVLAIGDGSDCAKVVAAGAITTATPGIPVLDRTKIPGRLPIYSVLTLSATGSEWTPQRSSQT